MRALAPLSLLVISLLQSPISAATETRWESDLAAIRQETGRGNYGKASFQLEKLRSSLMGNALGISRERLRQTYQRQDRDLPSVAVDLEEFEKAWRGGRAEEAEFRLRSAQFGLIALRARQDPQVVWAMARQDAEREPSVTTASMAAFAAHTAKQWESCVDYASRVLAGSPVMQNQHYTLQGACYLEQGQVAKAVEALWASVGETPAKWLGGSAPRMGLAKALLERQEKETVIDFLRRAGAMNWPQAAEKTGKWVAAIERGEKPDFGALALF